MCPYCQEQLLSNQVDAYCYWDSSVPDRKETECRFKGVLASSINRVSRLWDNAARAARY